MQKEARHSRLLSLATPLAGGRATALMSAFSLSSSSSKSILPSHITFLHLQSYSFQSWQLICLHIW